MWFAALSLAILVGSLPSAVLVGKLAGVDVRRSGSGNPGATNTWRTAGRMPGLIVLVLDSLKGWAATLWLPRIAGGEMPAWLPVGVGAACLIGHVFSPWLALRGGKGVATTAGVVGALAPRLLVVPLSLFVIVFAFRRRVSVASLAAAAALPVVALIYRVLPPPGWPQDVLIAACAAFAGILFWTHRENIARLRRREEPRLRL